MCTPAPSFQLSWSDRDLVCPQIDLPIQCRVDVLRRILKEVQCDTHCCASLEPSVRKIKHPLGWSGCDNYLTWDRMIMVRQKISLDVASLSAEMPTRYRTTILNADCKSSCTAGCKVGSRCNAGRTAGCKKSSESLLGTKKKNTPRSSPKNRLVESRNTLDKDWVYFWLHDSALRSSVGRFRLWLRRTKAAPELWTIRCTMQPIGVLWATKEAWEGEWTATVQLCTCQIDW